MSRPAVNLQDQFLNQARRESLQITIVLLDGTELSCVVKGFDNYTVVVVSENGAEHLLYKHAIAQLVSPRPLASARPQGGREGGGRRESGGRRPPRQSDGGGGKPDRASAGGSTSPAPKADGFNKLDLSSVKIDEKQAAEPKEAPSGD